MSFKILASINHFGLKDLDLIKTPIFSITDNQMIKNEIIDQDFKNMAGARTNQSYNKKSIAYFIEEDTLDNAEFIAKWGITLPQTASQIETLLLFLWFIRDNCVSLEQAYGLFTVAKKFNWWTGNNFFSTCDGQFKEVSFSENEITDATNLLFDYHRNCSSSKDLYYTVQGPNKAQIEVQEFQSSIDPFKEENRIERALTFLKTARAVPHVPQKITHYMSILECLFSTSATQIVTNISKRVACYLDDRKVDKTIRVAYDIRSRFVHGENMKRSHRFICANAIQTDDIIRRVLTKIIRSDHAVFLQNDRHEWFRQLTSKKLPVT
jgi:hypothetical protein